MRFWSKALESTPAGLETEFVTFLILQKGNVKLFTFNLKLSHSGEHVKQSSEYLENINKADIY